MWIDVYDNGFAFFNSHLGFQFEYHYTKRDIGLEGAISLTIKENYSDTCKDAVNDWCSSTCQNKWTSGGYEYAQDCDFWCGVVEAKVIVFFFQLLCSCAAMCISLRLRIFL